MFLYEYNTVAVIAPTDSIIDRDFAYLDQFISRGGRLLLAINNVKGNFQTASGELVKTGYSNWLSKYGISIEDNFVLRCKLQQCDGSAAARNVQNEYTC